MSLPNQKLNELDHLIIFSIAVTRKNEATVYEIIDSIRSLWSRHNLKFMRAKKNIPSNIYFYQRLERLLLMGYLEKRGSRLYKLNCEHYGDLVAYITSYIKLTYGIENV
jgi:hypothetical protein